MLATLVHIDGVRDVSGELSELSPKSISAARRAVNSTASWARTRASRKIREQVALPASYLSPSAGRLTVAKRASGADLEAKVLGRARPTSLARFISGASKRHVTVRVHPGVARRMNRAFTLRLRAGTADLDTKSNLGLAIRLKPGEKISNKHKMVGMGGGLYLLYGPSVNQVFRSIVADQTFNGEVSARLAGEYTRLLQLDLA